MVTRLISAHAHRGYRVKVTCLLAKAGSGVGLSFGVRALTEMEIRCVKGMLRLKLISSEKNSVFKGLSCIFGCNDSNWC